MTFHGCPNENFGSHTPTSPNNLYDYSAGARAVYYLVRLYPFVRLDVMNDTKHPIKEFEIALICQKQSEKMPSCTPDITGVGIMRISHGALWLAVISGG